jgi:hypothetical protein
MTQISTNRFGTESKLQASCRLVSHPEGAFNINGKPYRPEWGRGPQEDEYDRAEGAVELAVAEANKVCKEKDPKQVRIEMYDNGRTRIIIQE